MLLFGYWLAWALYPAQPAGFFSGFAAHWNKGNNFGNAFDVWFLNLFPTVKPYVANSGGYLTLSFIPTLGTMILGLAAGRWLRDVGSVDSDAATAGGGRDRHRGGPAAALHGHLSGGEAHLDAGVDAVQRRSVLPVPGGLLLADGGEGVSQVGIPAGGDRGQLDCGVPDGAPVGALHPGFVPDSPGRACLRVLRARKYEPFVRGIAVLLVYWALLYWMYRRKLFLKI